MAPNYGIPRPGQAGVYGPAFEAYITVPWSQFAYDYCASYTDVIARIGQLLQAQPHHFSDASWVQIDRWNMASEQRYLDEPISEITEADFMCALEQLPPHDWRHDAGVERFNCSELTSGRITRQYARRGDRYFSRYVRLSDKATYITSEGIDKYLSCGASPAISIPQPTLAQVARDYLLGTPAPRSRRAMDLRLKLWTAMQEAQ